MQPASGEQPWGFQANGKPGIFVQCSFVSHLKVLKALLFLLCFVRLFLWAWSLSGFNPSQCKVDLWAGKPLLPSPARGFHPDSPVQSGKKSRAGVLSLSFFLFRFINVSLQEISLFKQFLEPLMEEVREMGISLGINPHKAAPLPQQCPKALQKLSGASLTKSRTSHCNVFPASSIRGKSILQPSIISGQPEE